MRVVCDKDKCVGCLACVVTCIDHHYTEDALHPVSGRKYSRVTMPSGYTKYITESCYHCKKAACMNACLFGAISRDEQGWVIVDQDKCIGCGSCEKACPFHIPQFTSDDKMFKCDGCGGDPSCVKICPNGALSVK